MNINHAVAVTALIAFTNEADGQLEYVSGQGSTFSGVSPSCPPFTPLFSCDAPANQSDTGSFSINSCRESESTSRCAATDGSGSEAGADACLSLNGNQWVVRVNSSTRFPQSCGGTSSAEAGATATFEVPCRGRLVIDAVASEGNSDQFGGSQFCDAFNYLALVSAQLSVGGTTISSITGPTNSRVFDGTVFASELVTVDLSTTSNSAIGGDGTRCPGNFLEPTTGGSVRFELSFTEACLADQNGDGAVTPADFTAWVNNYNSGDLTADQNCDGVISIADYTSWVINYNAGC